MREATAIREAAINESLSAALALLRGCSVFRRAISLPVVVLCVANTVSAQSPQSDAAEVLVLEAKIAEAIVGGDVTFVDSVTPADFRMTHGDVWTRGGPPALVDNKESFLTRVEDRL